MKLSDSHVQPLDPAAAYGVLKIVLAYAAFGALWILLSDRVVVALFDDPQTVLLANTVKGWAFIAVTALLLGALLVRFAQRIQRPPLKIARRPQRLGAPGIIAALLALPTIIVVLTTVWALNLMTTSEHHSEDVVAQVAQDKSSRIGEWIRQRVADASTLGHDEPAADAMRAWVPKHDAAARQLLQARLASLLLAREHYHGFLIVDDLGHAETSEGRVLARVSEELTAAIRQAWKNGSIEVAELHRSPGGQPDPRIDIVVPYSTDAGQRKAALVLLADASRPVFAELQRWPRESATSEALLVRRENNELLFLSDSRHRPGTALNLRVPYGAASWTGLDGLSSGPGGAKVVKGTDYRQETVIAAVRPVSGTPWFVIAKTDHEEVEALARRSALWAEALGGTLLVATTFVVFWLHRRRTLADAQTMHAQEQERVRALNMLDALADGSTDAIFVKDAEGRYQLFNREAARVTGRASNLVIGNDDRAVFPAEDAAQVMANDRQVMARNEVITFDERVHTVDGTRFYQATKGPLHDADGRVIGIFGISRDITERRQAETALREQLALKEQFANVAANVPGVIFSVCRDPDGRRRAPFASSQLEDVFGISPESVAENLDALFARIHPEDMPGFTRNLESVGAAPRPWHEVFRYRHESKGIRWIEGWASPVGNSAEHPMWHGYVHDITDRKLAEQALQESENRWIMALDSAGHGVWDWNAATDKVYFSRQWKTMLGYADEDIGDSLHEWTSRVHPEDYAECMTVLKRHLDGHAPSYRSEHRLLCKDGSFLWVLDQGMVVARDDSGRPMRAVGTHTDITAQKAIAEELDRHRNKLEEIVLERTSQLQQANEILQQRAERIAELYNRAPCGYHSIDMQGRIIEINDTELAMLGYVREEIVGRKTIFDLVAPHCAQEVERQFEIFRRDGHIENIEHELVRKDGTFIPVVINVSAVRDSEGAIIASRTTVFDNRERKLRDRQIARLNDELEHRVEEAEAANQAKSIFLANMSHEIRTPMNAILGLAHLLRGELAGTRPADRIDKIMQSAHHLLDIINDILDISKIEAGKLALEIADFEIESVLRSVCTIVSDRVQAKGLELVVEVDPRLPRVVRGDATRLRQALLNYASNAVKFTDRGSITLRCSQAESLGDRLQVRFEVEDTGIGIAEPIARSLFRAFQQADSSTTRRFGGTGLGLAITKRLAELMQGEVGVTSTLGTGSTFWFTASVKPSPVQSETADARALPACHALIAADPGAARDALERLCGTLGMRVRSVADATSLQASIAASDAEDDPVQIVMLDKTLAGRSGIEIGAGLRAPNAAGTPLLWLLGEPDATEVRAMHQAGFDRALPKPVMSSSLRDALTQAASQAPAADLGKCEVMSTPPAAPTNFDGLRLLLVEDHPVNREVVLALLEPTGIAIQIAQNGKEAVDRAAAATYDVILMDVQMPVMDGLAATRAIRGLPNHANTPIIAMTADAFAEDRDRCIAAGMNDYVAKPFEPEHLLALIAKWTGSVHPAAAAVVAEPPTASPRPSDPGIDFKHGMLIANGKPERYHALLRDFVLESGKDLARLRREYTDGDLTGARRTCHSLKGAAALVGATRMQSLVHQLEQRLASPTPAADDAASLIEAIDAARTAIATHLDTALPPQDAAASQPDQDSAALSALSLLAEYLQTGDMRANRTLTDSMASISAYLGTSVDALRRQVESYDYEAAMETLRKALANRTR